MLLIGIQRIAGKTEQLSLIKRGLMNTEHLRYCVWSQLATQTSVEDEDTSLNLAGLIPSSLTAFQCYKSGSVIQLAYCYMSYIQ